MMQFPFLVLSAVLFHVSGNSSAIGDRKASCLVSLFALLDFSLSRKVNSYEDELHEWFSLNKAATFQKYLKESGLY